MIGVGPEVGEATTLASSTSRLASGTNTLISHSPVGLPETLHVVPGSRSASNTSRLASGTNTLVSHLSVGLLQSQKIHFFTVHIVKLQSEWPLCAQMCGIAAAWQLVNPRTYSLNYTMQQNHACTASDQYTTQANLSHAAYTYACHLVGPTSFLA